MINGGAVAFPPDEAHHASRVVRHREGDVVRIFDGEGTGYRVRMTRVSNGDVRGEVVERMPGENEPSYDLTLGVGLLKQRARFETMVEKAVELGVSALVPLITARTEKGGVRADRMDRIAVAAVKQCGRSRIPRIDEPVSIDDYLRDAQIDVGVICHEAARGAPSIVDALPDLTGQKIGALIGPEGGFDDEEVLRASEAGYRVVHLGGRRLRGETAAIVVASACMLSQMRFNSEIGR